jgi:hypothetical protein
LKQNLPNWLQIFFQNDIFVSFCKLKTVL